MSIATRARRGSRSVRSETRQRIDWSSRQKRLRSYGALEQRKNCLAINISPLWSDKMFCCFQLEFIIQAFLPALGLLSGGRRFTASAGHPLLLSEIAAFESIFI